jgi:putative methyltransferase (TIGR04325 family)
MARDARWIVRQVTPPIVLTAAHRLAVRLGLWPPVPAGASSPAPPPPPAEEPAPPPTVASDPVPPAAEVEAPPSPTPPAPPAEWEYVPEGWRPDDPRGLGWDHPSVVETQLRKWPDFVAAVRSTRPLGVYHEAAVIDSEHPSAHNFILAFAYVLARAAAAAPARPDGTRRLSVLDWGGGLGHYAVIARAVLPEVALDYTVFERPGAAEAGRGLLPDVTFSSDAEACLSRRYDLVFASGSLQYAVDWQGLLRRFAQAAEGWVFLSRTPYVDGTAGFVVVQRPHSAGYTTDYLSRVFNRGELLAQAEAAGLALDREFLMIWERVEAVGAPAPFEYRGYLFRAQSAAGG